MLSTTTSSPSPPHYISSNNAVTTTSNNNRRVSPGKEKLANERRNNNPPNTIHNQHHTDFKRSPQNHHHHHSQKRKDHHHPKHTPLPSLSMREFGLLFDTKSASALLCVKELARTDSRQLWDDTRIIKTFMGTTCPICFDSPPRVAFAIPCGHVFCGLCFLRCLSFNSLSGIDSCPVCQDQTSLRRNLAKRCLCSCLEIGDITTGVMSFTLVPAMDPMSLAPRSSLPFAEFRRFQVCEPEVALSLLQRQREDLVELRTMTAKFRDVDSIVFLNVLERELDEDVLMWTSCYSTTPPPAGPIPPPHNGEPRPHSYQSSDGCRVFMSRLDQNIIEACIIPTPTSLVNVRVEYLEHDSRPNGMPRDDLPLGSVNINAVIDLSSITDLDLNQCPKPLRDELHRRRQARATMLRRASQLKDSQLKSELKTEAERRDAREAQEKAIAAFFGFDDERKRAEAKRAMEAPPPPAPVHSFSSVVLNNGFFPALPSTIVPKKAAMSEPHDNTAGSEGANSPPPATTTMTTNGKNKKKVVSLFANNPSMRRDMFGGSG